MSAAALANREKVEVMIPERVSARYNVDPALIRAVIQTESNWNSKAISSKGALGLMQLVPGTARQMGVSNAFDPKQNLDGGVRYLRTLLERYNGDLDKALAAYNAGPGAVDRAGGVPQYRETREYVRKVTDSYFRPGSGSPSPMRTDAPKPIYRMVNDERTGSVYERMRQTVRHRAAKNRPKLSALLASLVVLSIFSCHCEASADNSTSNDRHEAAKSQFDRAEKDRQALEAKSENVRTLKDYTSLVSEYRRVALIHCRAPRRSSWCALNEVAEELNRTMGDLFDQKYLPDGHRFLSISDS